MMKLVLVIIFAVLPVVFACTCEFMQPQEKICHDDFVGIIEILAEDIRSNIFPGVMARAKIVKVFKGKYQDFRPNDMIYIYSDPGSCLLDVWSGKQIISGKTYNGGVKMDRCSFRELFDYFTPQQIEAIDSHIRSNAYDRGCSACKIKKQYDFSMSKDNECRDVYEFPVQTSACVAGNDGTCGWVDVSQRRVQLPGPHDFTTRNPGTAPTEFAIHDPTPTPVTRQNT
uniref:NTR domain-containing protein n=2 Tax=Ciona intestinalis TaxID=7719 RepID=H2XVP2_CIOIN